ncbi:MAG: GNVR domain-containing protein [Bacteroidota bacterium]
MKPDNDKITLKDFVLTAKDWISYVVAKWKLVVITGMLCGAGFFTYALLKNKVYLAELTFALEEKGSGMGAYAGIASQFGIDLGKNEGGAFIGDNILELFRSQLIIEKSLLSVVEIDKEKELLVNRYIRFNQLQKTWEGEPGLAGIKFTPEQLRKDYSRAQDSILHAITRRIKEQNLIADKLDKRLSIMSIRFRSEDELFAKLFVEVLAANVHEFYIESKTYKMRNNLNILQFRVDSVKSALDQEMFNVAVNQDNNINPVMAKGKVGIVKKQMSVQLLTAMYTELIKNLEMSKLTLMHEEPLIQVIDTPVLPLSFTKPGKLSSLVIGGILGGIAGILFIICRRVYQQVILS